MKKVLSTIAIVAASVAFAQVGISGNTSDVPQATLDVKAMKLTNKPDGVLVPRLTRAEAKNMNGTIQESTLIYIDNATAGTQTGTVADVDAKGFYYYDTAQTKWVKLGGGAGGDNIYSADGTLAGNRVVTQGDNDITYTTGNGQFVIDGTSKLNGSSYVKTTRITSGAAYTVTEKDYLVVVDGPTNQFIVTVPAASTDNAGRVMIFANKTAGNLVLNDPNGNQILNGTQAEQIAPNNGQWIVSDGTKWYNLINY